MSISTPLASFAVVTAPDFERYISENGGDLQMILFFALFAVFTLVELAAPKRPKAEGKQRRWIVNLGLTALNVVALSALPVTFFGVALWAESRGYGLLRLVEMPFLLLLLSNLLLRGFISFFTHFLMHKVPFLWRFHRVHHLDTELDVSSTVRFHPGEFVLNLVPGIPLVILFGFTPWILLFYELFDVAVTLFSHSNVRLPRALDRVLRYIIVTPDLHRVHHSSFRPETDSNYSAVFPIWDVIFRTFRTDTREPQETMQLGLEEVRGDSANRFWWLLLSPLRSSLAQKPGVQNTRRLTDTVATSSEQPRTQLP